MADVVRITGKNGASIPHLEIVKNANSNKVTCTVTAAVYFPLVELRKMELGIKTFTLNCELWASDDSWWDETDNKQYIYTYPKSFPDDDPKDVTFVATFESSKLNEDDRPTDRRDEIYGQLILTNTDNLAERITANTNEVYDFF